MIYDPDFIHGKRLILMAISTPRQARSCPHIPSPQASWFLILNQKSITTKTVCIYSPCSLIVDLSSQSLITNFSMPLKGTIRLFLLKYQVQDNHLISIEATFRSPSHRTPKLLRLSVIIHNLSTIGRAPSLFPIPLDQQEKLKIKKRKKKK